MSIGRTKEEQELNDRLVRGLVVKEVFEPMSKIGWGHGTPPPPDYSGQPAPAEGAPAAPQVPAAQKQGGPPAAASPAKPDAGKADTPPSDLNALYESLRDPETGLIARKYKTVEEAIKGSVHLVHMAKQAFSERDEAVKKLQSIGVLRHTPEPSAPAAPPASAATVPSRDRLDAAQANLDAVLSKIADEGGVLDGDANRELSKAQRELAEAAAAVHVETTRNSQVEREDADRRAWAQVDQYMTDKYPDSTKFSEEVALHVESDPLLQSAVKALLDRGDKLKATELAWTSFERAHRDAVSQAKLQTDAQKEEDLTARGQVRKEVVDNARKDAGIVTGSAGGGGMHENPNAGSTSPEEIERLRDAMRREGDAPGSAAAMRFRRAIIPLDPNIFGPQ